MRLNSVSSFLGASAMKEVYIVTKAKYFLSALLIAICLFIAGELQPMIASENLSDFPSLCLSIENSITREETPEQLDKLINVLTEAAESNGVGIFISDYESQSNIEETECLYYAGDPLESIDKAVNGHYDYVSVLSGISHFKTVPLNEARQFKVVIAVYFCGDTQSVRSAQRYIREHLDLSSHADSTANGNTFLHMELGAFAIALLIIMMFSLSDTEARKKEFILKYIYGESKWKLISKYYLTDALTYCIIIAALVFAVSKLNSLMYCLGIVMVFSLCILAGAFLCCLPLLTADPIAVLKGRNSKKKALSINRFVKVLVSAMIVCVIAVFITLLNESDTYIKTEDFFEQHSDYSFCQMEHDNEFELMTYDRENYVDSNYKTACDYYDICQPLLINREEFPVYNDEEQPGDNGYYIFANSNMMDYLKTNIAELESADVSEDYIIIAPEDTVNDEFIENCLTLINSRYNVYFFDEKVLYSRENVRIIKTEKSYKVFATDNSKESEMGVYKNEPIIICTVPENKSAYPPKEMNLGSMPYYMLKMNDELKNELIEKEGYTKFVQTNCKENFDYFWRMNKLGLIYFGAFSIMLVLLEVIVLSFVVKLEFDLNKEEFCIKRVLGYTLISRYGELIAETLISSFICCALSIFLLSLLDTNTPALAATAVSVILLVLEFVMIIFYAIKLEKANIQKILKGGAL